MMRGDRLIRLHRALDRARRGEEGSAMVMALILMMVFAVAGVVLAVVIGVNSKLTLQTASRGTSVYIAEAGLETALGMFRAADGAVTGVGDLSRLPCQVTGSADGSGDAAQQFQVTIRYGLEDPSAHATDDDWLGRANTAGVDPNGYSPVTCSASGPASQPYYALVESKAAQGEVGARTLLAVYHFDIDTSHTTAGKLGDEILVYLDSTLCLRADSATAGSLVKYSKSCDRSDPTDSALLGWIYDSDLRIRLASTIMSDDPTTAEDESANALCIAGPVAKTDGSTQTVTTYRWEYSFNAVSYKSGGKTTTWDAATYTTTESTTMGSLATQVKITVTGAGGASSSHYYNRVGSLSPGAEGAGVAVTPHDGEYTRTEYVTPYSGSGYYTADMVSYGTDPTATEASGYPRLVRIVVTKPADTGTDYLGKGTVSGATTAYAMLVNCDSLNGTRPDGTVYAADEGGVTWGWEASNSWQSAAGWCLFSGRNGSNPVQGDTLSVVKDCAISAQQTYAAYNPLTGVGAGAAGPDAGYLLNFKEFGKCADVNGGAAANGLIVYPCKQDAIEYPNLVPKSNQAFWSVTDDEPSGTASIKSGITISVVINSTKYCMVDPKDSTLDTTKISDPNDKTHSPRVLLSTNCTQNAAKWTRYADTGRYASSYIIVSSTGLCLTAQPSNTPSTGGWSGITVEGCNGQAAQKWNAPADLTDGGLGDYQEIPAGGETTP